MCIKKRIFRDSYISSAFIIDGTIDDRLWPNSLMQFLFYSLFPIFYINFQHARRMCTHQRSFLRLKRMRRLLWSAHSFREETIEKIACVHRIFYFGWMRHNSRCDLLAGRKSWRDWIQFSNLWLLFAPKRNRCMKLGVTSYISISAISHIVHFRARWLCCSASSIPSLNDVRIITAIIVQCRFDNSANNSTTR